MTKHTITSVRKRKRTRTQPKRVAKKKTVTRVHKLTLVSVFPSYRDGVYATAVFKRQDGFVRELRDAYLHKGLVLYLGAGVSRSLGLPNWSELIRALTVAMMSRKVQSAIATARVASGAKFWQALQTIQAEVERGATADRPILMMARSIKDAFGKDLAAMVLQTLYSPLWRNFGFLEDKQGIKRTGKIPGSPLLDAIVKLARAERDVAGVNAIVNYNFDDLERQTV